MAAIVTSYAKLVALILTVFFPTYALYLEALKKPISILLIVLLLFNALGFYGLLQGLRYKTSADLVKRLDTERYSEDETILLKIPVAVPYQMDSEDYERVDGEFEHKGEFYRLVKQKYQNDTLFMVCIKDHASKRIEQALTDYVKTFTDKPVDSKNNSKTTINFIKDYLPSRISIYAISGGWNYDISFSIKEYELLNRAQSIASPPPRS